MISYQERERSLVEISTARRPLLNLILSIAMKSIWLTKRMKTVKRYRNKLWSRSISVVTAQSSSIIKRSKISLKRERIRRIKRKRRRVKEAPLHLQVLTLELINISSE